MLAKKIKKNLGSTKIEIIKNKKDPDKRDYIVSNQKILKTGFKFKYSLDEGIVELIDGIKKLGKGSYTNVVEKINL